MKKPQPKRSTPQFHGDRSRPVFPNGSYLSGRLASSAVRAHIPSQQLSPMARAAQQAKEQEQRESA
jgi:hypothetical protein